MFLVRRRAILLPSTAGRSKPFHVSHSGLTKSFSRVLPSTSSLVHVRRHNGDYENRRWSNASASVFSHQFASSTAEDDEWQHKSSCVTPLSWTIDPLQTSHLTASHSFLTANGSGIVRQRRCHWQPPLRHSFHCRLLNTSNSKVLRSLFLSPIRSFCTEKEQLSDSAKSETKSKGTSDGLSQASTQTKAQKPTAVKSKSRIAMQSPATWRSYLNPVFLSTKLAKLTWRIVYVTLDSVFRPWKGVERVRYTWKVVATEMSHYWSSTKLLGSDLRLSLRILRKMSKGYELSFRERRHLKRTALDMLRMIPFVFFIIIPFLELLLPVALIVFPGLLPSQFRSTLKKAEDRKRQLRLRLDLAKFMEDTLIEFSDSLISKKRSVQGAERLADLVTKVQSGREVTNDEILKVSPLFDDHITLDNATNAELKNLCQYMGLTSFGPPAILRIRLHSRIRELRREDRGIRKEGVDKLQGPLLRQLVRERGMRADLSDHLLRSNLNKWIALSLDYNVPTSLLIASRVFTIQHIPGEEPEELLKKRLKVAAESAYDEVLVEKAGVADSAKEKAVVDRQSKLMQEEEGAARAEAQALLDKAQAEADAELEHVKVVAEAAAEKFKDLQVEHVEVGVEAAELEQVSLAALEEAVREAGELPRTLPAAGTLEAVKKEAAEETKAKQAYKHKLLSIANSLHSLMSESAVEHEKEAVNELIAKLRLLGKTEEELIEALEAEKVVVEEGVGEQVADGLEADIEEEEDVVVGVETVIVGGAEEGVHELAEEKMVDETGAEVTDEATVLADDFAEAEAAEMAQRELEQRELDYAHKTMGRLTAKVGSMLGHLDKRIDATHCAIGDTMKLFESNTDITYHEAGVVVREQMDQLLVSDEELNMILKDLDIKGDDKLSKAEVDEMLKILKRELSDENGHSETDVETDIEDADTGVTFDSEANESK